MDKNENYKQKFLSSLTDMSREEIREELNKNYRRIKKICPVVVLNNNGKEKNQHLPNQ